MWVKLSLLLPGSYDTVVQHEKDCSLAPANQFSEAATMLADMMPELPDLPEGQVDGDAMLSSMQDRLLKGVGAVGYGRNYSDVDRMLLRRSHTM